MQGYLYEAAIPVRGRDSGVENPHVKTSELPPYISIDGWKDLAPQPKRQVLEARHPAEHFLLASFHLCVTIQVACTRMTGKTSSLVLALLCGTKASPFNIGNDGGEAP
jgi:hypothetical protein